MRNCSAKCLKFIVFGFNFLLWLIGLGMLAVGIYMRLDSNFRDAWNSIWTTNGGTMGNLPNLDILAYVVIGLGVAIFIFGFLGCGGACCENRCLLGLYVFVVVIAMIAQIAIVVVAIVFNSQLDTNLRNSLVKNVQMNVRTNWTVGDPGQRGLTSFIFQLQYNERCCGINGPNDYLNVSQYWKDNNSECRAVPLTCCERNLSSSWESPVVVNQAHCCSSTNSGVDYRNPTGCYDSISNVLKKNIILVISIGIVFAILQVLVLVSATGLCVAIGNERREWH